MIASRERREFSPTILSSLSTFSALKENEGSYFVEIGRKKGTTLPESIVPIENSVYILVFNGVHYY